MTSEDEFLRSTVGLIAHVLNELVAIVGMLNVSAVLDEEARTSLNQDLDELHALTTRIAKAFPPPSPNGSD
jgi:hypothetical protein